MTIVVGKPVPTGCNQATLRGRFPGWSAPDLALLRELWAAGVALADIAGRLGRSREAVRSRARRMRLAPRRARRGIPMPAAAERACLNCHAPFASQGPHHRLCDACREGSGDFRVAL